MGVRDKKQTWFLTYPQNESTMAVLLERLQGIDDLSEYLIACEPHKDGSPHLHAYVKFKRGVTLKEAPTVFNCIGKSGNYQPARSCKAVIAYCTKGDTYISNFDIEKYQAKKGKVTSETLRTYTTIEALDKGIVSLNSLKAYEFARSLAVVPKSRDDVCGLWLYGPAGTGKSRYARDVAGDDVYLKAQNKWWDGYTGQSFVILDDLDEDFKSWHNIKIWTDRYSCQGEIKGGQVSLNHELFIVTSNHSIKELLPGEDKKRLYEAVKRRFKVIHFESHTYNQLAKAREEEKEKEEEEVIPRPAKIRREDTFEKYCRTGQLPN